MGYRCEGRHCFFEEGVLEMLSTQTLQMPIDVNAVSIKSILQQFSPPLSLPFCPEFVFFHLVMLCTHNQPPMLWVPRVPKGHVTCQVACAKGLVACYIPPNNTRNMSKPCMTWTRNMSRNAPKKWGNGQTEGKIIVVGLLSWLHQQTMTICNVRALSMSAK